MEISGGYVFYPLFTSCTSSQASKANVLINNDGHACVSDLSLLTITSASQSFIPSYREDGAIRWMSPELLAPDMFELKKSRPTKESDCYALGMTIYEVLSGQVPFASFKPSALIWKIASGEHPERPQGGDGIYFTDGVWGVVQRSWEFQPRNRISASDVLLGLEENPIPLEPPSSASGDVETDGDDQSGTTASDSGMFSLFHPRLIYSYPCGTPGLPIARGGDGPPGPSLNPPPSARTRPMTPQDGVLLQDQPQTGIAKGGRIGDRLARGAREMFKAATRKFFGP